MSNVITSVKKHVFLVVLLLIALVAAAGCQPPNDSAIARIRIDSSNLGVLTQEVNRANSAQTATAKEDEPLASPTYQIIIDGNLGALTNWGSKEAGDYATGNGFLDKKCTTYDSLIMLLSEITSGEKTVGYFSCERGEAAPDPDSEMLDGALQANYFRYDEEFSSDSNSTKYYTAHKNLAYLVSDVAATAAKNADSRNVFILITDLAMQNESQSSQIADALAKYVVANDSLTMSLIGIQADYVGKINNVPRTSIGIEPKRVFGEPTNSNKVFQRYVYLLIIGNPEQVYETTNQIVEKCKNNRNLNRDDQVKSVYFSGLECISSQEANTSGGVTQTAAEPKTSFCGNILSYGAVLTEEEIRKYVFSFDDSVTQEDTNVLLKIPFAKIYSGAPAPTGKNIQVVCSFPFALRSCIKQSSASLADEGTIFLFLKNNPTVSVSEAERLDLAISDDKLTASITGWITCGTDILAQSGAPAFDLGSGLFQTGLTINNSMLKQDLPAILSITLQPSFMPDRSKLLEVFGANWMLDWSMDMKAYNQDWDTHAFTFAQATKTAYLAETFLYNLLGRQIDRNIADATAEMSAYTETFVLGVVKHDKASAYVADGKTEPGNNFGWAFKQDEVDKFPNP